MALPMLMFAVVTVGLFGLFFAVTRLIGADRSRVRRRMAETGGGEGPDVRLPALYKNLDVLNLDAAGEYGLLGQEKTRRARFNLKSLENQLAQHLEQARLPLGPRAFLLVVAASALALAAAGALAFRWAGCVAGLAGPALAFAIVRHRCRRQRANLLRQLPAAFELMARVIRSGQSVAQSFHAVGEAFEDPLAAEFASCSLKQNFGLAPEVAFQEMARRSGILEMRIFVMAMSIQQKSGGNLSDTLDRLAALIRMRLKLKQHVRTLTAEGRLQGWTLVVLPFIMFAALFVLNRRYAETLLEHGSLLAATGACMLVGVLWIRRILDFEG